jgi:hypothetical protein
VVRDRVASYGRATPSTTTATWPTGGGKELGEVSTELMQRFTVAVVGLVRGEVTWDVSGPCPVCGPAELVHAPGGCSAIEMDANAAPRYRALIRVNGRASTETREPAAAASWSS